MEWYVGVLRKYAEFDGRARRKEYWMFVLINTVIGWGLGRVDNLLGIASSDGYGLLSGFYSLAVLIPSLAVMVRRLHDAGKSGWFFFINLIPIIGWIWFFIVLVTDGEAGSNQYGANPKESGSSGYSPKGWTTIGQSAAGDPSETHSQAAATGGQPNQDLPDQIRKLAELRDAGIITAEEFEAKKRDLLDKM